PSAPALNDFTAFAYGTSSALPESESNGTTKRVEHNDKGGRSHEAEQRTRDLPGDRIDGGSSRRLGGAPGGHPGPPPVPPRPASEESQAPRPGSEHIRAPRTRSQDPQAPRTNSEDIRAPRGWRRSGASEPCSRSPGAAARRSAPACFVSTPAREPASTPGAV